MPSGSTPVRTSGFSTETLIGSYARGLVHERLPRWPRGDLHQLGGDVMLNRGGDVVFVRDHGVTVNSLLLGSLSALVYVTELLFASLAGSFSDQRGRRGFLLAGLLLSTVAALLIPLGSTDIAQLAYFDGLVYLTVILALAAMGPLVATIIARRSKSDPAATS